jgi:hypothetical protein
MKYCTKLIEKFVRVYGFIIQHFNYGWSNHFGRFCCRDNCEQKKENKIAKVTQVISFHKTSSIWDNVNSSIFQWLRRSFHPPKNSLVNTSLKKQ